MKNLKNEYAIFIDIDGTLIGKNNDALKENLNTIQKVRKSGHKVFISTGRGTAYLPKEIDIKNNFDGVISGVGAIIKIGEKEVVKRLMPYDNTEKFCELTLKYNLPSALEGEENLYYFSPMEKFYDVKKEGWIKLDKDNWQKIVTPDIPVEKFTVLGEIPEEMDDAMGQDCTILRFGFYGEIIQKKCGKGSSMLEVLEILGIPVEQSIAIGDSINDMDMLQKSGISVAMGNSPDTIKDISNLVTDDVDNAGVSKALIKIFSL